MPKVSIIMPIYNCEEYLSESLGSVLCQTFSDWELVCVDDGSTDRSLEILQEYREKDSRIRIYTQHNQGAGVARNLGLQECSGEFVAFLDADDYYYDSTALEKMYDACKKYDVNACGSMVKLLRGDVTGDDSNFALVQEATKTKDILEYGDFQFDYGYYGFIFKTAVLKEHGITFPDLRRFQDPPFFVEAMFHIGKFCFVDSSLYCYRTPTVSSRFNVAKTVDLVKGLILNMEFALAHDLDLLFMRTLKRLEVEYGNLICHNMTTDSTELLELLLKANGVVRQGLQDDKYVVKPLTDILNGVAKAEEYCKKDIFLRMQQCERLYIYGAGNATVDFVKYLDEQGLRRKVCAIIVTSRQGNPDAIGRVPVITLDDYQKQEKDLILITVTSIYREEIEQNLQALGVSDYVAVDVRMMR